MTETNEPDLQMLTRELPLTSERELTGSVRWFNPEKGYGFIAPDDGSDDVFVRFSSIQHDGFRALEGGQRVAYFASWDARGPRAINVRSL